MDYKEVYDKLASTIFAKSNENIIEYAAQQQCYVNDSLKKLHRFLKDTKEEKLYNIHTKRNNHYDYFDHPKLTLEYLYDNNIDFAAIYMVNSDDGITYYYGNEMYCLKNILIDHIDIDIDDLEWELYDLTDYHYNLSNLESVRKWDAKAKARFKFKIEKLKKLKKEIENDTN